MYVVRRTWAVHQREARRVATIVSDIAKEYEKAGQRSDVRVYFNNGTIPGEQYRVYMEWIEESIRSPYRGGHELPPRAEELQAEARKYSDDSWIEFFELMTPDKELRD